MEEKSNYPNNYPNFFFKITLKNFEFGREKIPKCFQNCLLKYHIFAYSKRNLHSKTYGFWKKKPFTIIFSTKKLLLSQNSPKKPHHFLCTILPGPKSPELGGLGQSYQHQKFEPNRA